MKPPQMSDNEYADTLEMIVGAARIIAKRITTRSDTDSLSRLLVRLAQGDAAYADSAKLRAAFESHRKQTDDWKTACQELESTQGDLEQELQRLGEDLAEAVDQAKHDRNDRDRFKEDLERVTAINDTLHAENMRLKDMVDALKDVARSFARAARADEAETELVLALRKPTLWSVIYTVTVVRKQADTRMWGWYSDLAVAREHVLTNATDLFEHYYDHAVIEETPGGVLPITQRRWWFAATYSEGTVTVQPVDAPDWAANIVNWGMG